MPTASGLAAFASANAVPLAIAGVGAYAVLRKDENGQSLLDKLLAPREGPVDPGSSFSPTSLTTPDLSGFLLDPTTGYLTGPDGSVIDPGTGFPVDTSKLADTSPPLPDDVYGATAADLGKKAKRATGGLRGYLSRVGKAIADPYTIGNVAAFGGLGLAASRLGRGAAKAAVSTGGAVAEEAAVAATARGAGGVVTRGIARGVSAAPALASAAGAGTVLGVGTTAILQRTGALNAVASAGQAIGAKANSTPVGRAAVTVVQAGTAPIQVVGGLVSAAAGRGTVSGNLKDATAGVRREVKVVSHAAQSAAHSASKFAKRLF